MATVSILRPRGTKNAWVWSNLDRYFMQEHPVEAGLSSHVCSLFKAGMLIQDLHIDKVHISLENAPGTDKDVTVTVSDGTTTMTITVSDAAVSGSTVTNNFDLDVSEKDLTIAMTTTAGTATGCAIITVEYHEVTIT